MVPSSGNSSGVYTTLVKSGGSDGHTFAAAYTNSGNTSAFPQTTVGTGACGICFNSSAGTTTLGGQTVSKRCLIPVGGVDIYETVDGGNTWAATGFATALGTAAFSLNDAVVNSGGVYYVSVSFGGLYRYIGNGTAGGGTWTNITPSGFTPTYYGVLIVDPTDPTYLTLTTGGSGLAVGATSTSANSGTPSWTTAAATIAASAPSYDIPYLNYIFGQGHAAYFAVLNARIDSNGDTIVCGNQSIWKITGRLVYSGTPTITCVSFGRGQEATVAQEAWRPSGGSYVLMAPQDLGGVPLNGTYLNYPSDLFHRSQQWTCSSIEESPTDGTFVVARITSQNGGGGTADSGQADGSGYSTNAGLSWNRYAVLQLAHGRQVR